MSIFFAWADILSEKNPYFGKHLFCKQRLVTRTSFVYKTSRLVMISLLINALNKRVLLFSREGYFIKAIENLFSRVCISWYKHSRGWESSRQLCKPSTKLSRILPTPLVFILGYANTENVFYCLNGMFKFSEHLDTGEMHHRVSIARERDKISLFRFRPYKVSSQRRPFAGITQS